MCPAARAGDAGDAGVAVSGIPGHNAAMKVLESLGATNG
jgi:hypothetical protein